MALLLLLLLLLLPPLNLCAAAPVQAQAAHPVVLVPGDGGNQLWARLQGTKSPWYCEHWAKAPVRLWLELTSMTALSVECLKYNLKLKRAAGGRTADNDGVDAFVPQFGRVDSMEYLTGWHLSTFEYFGSVVRHLQDSLNLTRNHQVRGAPYDFRRAPDELEDFFKATKTLVEETFNAGGNRSVVLVAHSMGCKLTLHFLHRQSQAWKEKYIKEFVAGAPPFSGSITTLRAMLSGYNLGIPTVRGEWFRPVQRSWPSVPYLLPDAALVDPDAEVVRTPARNYTLRRLRRLFHDAGYPEGFGEYQRLGRLTDAARPPGVAVRCLFGVGYDTPSVLVWRRTADFPDKQPSGFEFGDGDGTVPAGTAGVCRRWRRRQRQRVLVHLMPSVPHLPLLHHRDFLRHVQLAAQP